MRELPGCFLDGAQSLPVIGNDQVKVMKFRQALTRASLQEDVVFGGHRRQPVKDAFRDQVVDLVEHDDSVEPGGSLFDRGQHAVLDGAVDGRVGEHVHPQDLP